MSVDLQWDKLSPSLADKLVDILNKQLSTVSRPSFIGHTEVISMDFGTTCPDIRVVDMRDIYRDFLEADENEMEDVKVTEGTGAGEEGFEWVSRRTAGRAAVEEGPAYHHLPPHIRYGRGAPSDYFAPPPGVHSPPEFWKMGMGMNVGMGGMAMSMPSLPHVQTSPSRLGLASSVYSTPMGFGGTPVSTPGPSRSNRPPTNTPATSSSKAGSPERDSLEQPETTPVQPAPDKHPNLQLHLRTLFHSDLRLTITTSLLINYPSPKFMSLPIKLSVVGLIFNGEIVVAYEGERQRVHFCILDDLDPYGPAGDRPRRDSEPNTPPDSQERARSLDKPLPVGQRLLPSIFIESEIGQEDKHVLRNVSGVERFIQDVIRKTIEDELVFPNFHTLILGDE